MVMLQAVLFIRARAARPNAAQCALFSHLPDQSLGDSEALMGPVQRALAINK